MMINYVDFYMNAVAPDWNLKQENQCWISTSLSKCSRTRLEFKVFVDAFILFYKVQCSRTRLEFKVKEAQFVNDTLN